jgi:hypothetical protein
LYLLADYSKNRPMVRIFSHPPVLLIMDIIHSLGGMGRFRRFLTWTDWTRQAVKRTSEGLDTKKRHPLGDGGACLIRVFERVSDNRITSSVKSNPYIFRCSLLKGL